MLRILLALVWIAVTVYAIADWLRTPNDEAPAHLNRQMWLLMIILTIPMYSLGAIAWIVLRMVTKAEASGSAIPPVGPFRRPNQQAPQEPLAPDDNPDFLFKLERDLQRKRREQEARQNPPNTQQSADSKANESKEDASAPNIQPFNVDPQHEDEGLDEPDEPTSSDDDSPRP